MTKPTTDRLIFFGTDAFSVPTLIRLLAEGWNIVAVITKPDSPAGRGRETTMPAVKKLALASSIRVLQPDKLSDANDEITALKPRVGIVVAYGKIIPASTIKLFPKGLINIHASLLPRHRGAAPIEAALLAGDTSTGISLMRIEPGLDTGPVFNTTKLQLTGTETRLQLYEQLAELGAELLATKLAGILAGDIVPIPQSHAHATHVSRLSKTDGDIDWSKPAATLEREVRAYLGWPGSHARVAGTEAVITAAHTTNQDGHPGTAYRTPSGELAVYAGSGSLVIDRLKPAGKREMTGPEFLSGHPL